jgi:hypothetical protein
LLTLSKYSTSSPSTWLNSSTVLQFNWLLCKALCSLLYSFSFLYCLITGISHASPPITCSEHIWTEFVLSKKTICCSSRQVWFNFICFVQWLQAYAACRVLFIGC